MSINHAAGLSPADQAYADQVDTLVAQWDSHLAQRGSEDLTALSATELRTRAARMLNERSDLLFIAVDLLRRVTGELS
jgi:hypothetical protein